MDAEAEISALLLDSLLPPSQEDHIELLSICIKLGVIPKTNIATGA